MTGRSVEDRRQYRAAAAAPVDLDDAPVAGPPAGGRPDLGLGQLALDDDHETVSLLPGLAGPACWPHQASEGGCVARGYLDELAERVAWSEAHRHLFGRFAG